MDRSFLKRFAWLSVGAAVTTIALKTVAYLLTGSVGLLSDAAESVVNLIGAVVALYMLIIAARPADEDHAFGHSKAEYFSSGIEGALIVLAAISIAVAAIGRLLNPQPLEPAGIGLLVAVAASVVNFSVARVLAGAGRKYNSITLEADAKHLMTDVWTSAGVIVAVAVVALTDWLWLDSVIALAVAVNILWSAFGLLKRSVQGLMDSSLPAPERAEINKILERYRVQGVAFHALRTRQAAARRFVSFHVLVPGSWPVQQGHDMLEKIEQEIRGALPEVTVDAHLEPVEDPVSHADAKLDR